MPLAALDLSSVAEDLADRFAQPLRAVDDAKNALLEGEPSFDEIPQKLYDRFSPLSRRLREAEHLLVAGLGHSHADDHLFTSNSLPVDPESQEVLFLQRSVLKLLQGLLGPGGVREPIARGRELPGALNPWETRCRRAGRPFAWARVDWLRF